MDPRLQEMLDHHEIRKLLAEYVHGCDRADAAQMGSVYWEDSWDDHGITQAPGPEFARVMTQRILTESDGLAHLLGQSLIKVDGDIAGAETYFLAVTTIIAADGTRKCNQLGGRYVDRLERRGGEWKVKHRITMRDWSISLTVEEDSYLRANLTPGHRSAEDASYAALSMTHGGAA